MTFLTIFTAPKPFTDPHVATIQRNAVRSWLQLGDDVEVLMVGDEEGMAEASAEMGVRHLTGVAVNEYGTPLVSSIFELARQASQGSLLAYVNADILLMPDLVETARRVSQQTDDFLMVGQRWNLSVDRILNFDDGWVGRLRDDVAQRGQLHLPTGSDYFIFPRRLYTQIPDFAIGRAGWDNWMIYHGCQQPWPVVDTTQSAMVVHQSHDYGHLPGGRVHYKLGETERNAQLGGGHVNMYILLDAGHEIVNGKLRPARLTPARLVRRVELRLTPPDDQRRGLRWRAVRGLRRLRRRMT